MSDSISKFEDNNSSGVLYNLTYTQPPIKTHAIFSLNPINHPQHYGGKDNPYEAIKVIEAWGLNYNLGNALKYIFKI